MREKELVLEYKAKKLELHNVKTRIVEVYEVPFDVGKDIHFVTHFKSLRWTNILCILKRLLPV